jgi:Uma2 family endonuclease
MEVASHPKLTVDEFFEAISGADGRYELINGVAYAMAGAKEGHNVVVSVIKSGRIRPLRLDRFSARSSPIGP